MFELKIGEVAGRSGLTVRTLRHYDDLGLVSPSGRTSGEHRLYSANDLHRLLAVVNMRALGMSLASIKGVLDGPAFDAAEWLQSHIAALEERIAAEGALLDRLRDLASAAETGWESMLSTISLVEALKHPSPLVRLRAALAAPESVDVAVLLRHLCDEPDDAVAETLIWAVARHGTAGLTAAVPLAGDPDPLVRRRIAQVLGKLALPAGRPVLDELRGDADPGVARMAAIAHEQLRG